MTQNNETSDLDVKHVVEVGTIIKMLGAWMIAIVIAVSGVIFWVQSQGVDKYYPKLAGENLERQLVQFWQKFDTIEAGNKEILKILIKLETNHEDYKKEK